MAEALSAIRITFFELVSYVLPGGLAYFLFTSSLPGNNVLIGQQITFLHFALFFLIGIAIHSVSIYIKLPNQYLWSAYHLLKETYPGSTKTNYSPITRRGKLAMFIRNKLIGKDVAAKSGNNSLAIQADNKVVEVFALAEITPLELFALKEAVFLNNPEHVKNYEHLHYHKLLSNSLATLFICYGLMALILDILGNFTFTLSGIGQFNHSGLAAEVAGICFIASWLLLNRADFYKNCRSRAVNASNIIYFNSKIHGNRD